MIVGINIAIAVECRSPIFRNGTELYVLRKSRADNDFFVHSYRRDMMLGHIRMDARAIFGFDCDSCTWGFTSSNDG